MKIRDFKRGFLIFLIILFSVFLISCGTGDDDDDGGGVPDDGTGGGTALGDVISLRTTQATVQSNNIDNAVITATVLDNYGAVVEDVRVTFATSAGYLSASSIITGVNGEASVTFTSGTDNNQTATITASATGVSPVSIPIQIIGSYLTLLSTSNSIPDNGSEIATLTITAMNAADELQSGVPITLTAAGTGEVILSETDGFTDGSGVFAVTVTGISAGGVTVTAQGLGDTKSVDFTVYGSGDDVFGIYSLEGEDVFADPYPLFTDTDLTIVVNAPNPPVGVTRVLFATTVGEWDPTGSKVIFKDIVAGDPDQAVATLSSPDAGSATVEVYYEGSVLPKDSVTVAISRPSIAADNIEIQANARYVQPSLGSETNTVALTATVTSSGQPVGGAAVAFSIENPVGGGEVISPVVVITDNSGVAESTFESGTLSTDANGVTLKASVIGAIPPIEDDIAIVIGGTALSLAIGYSTVIQSNESETQYLLPMSVLVTDAEGTPVSGATVTLGLWPIAYRTGAWHETYVVDKPVWRIYTSGIFTNEDVNLTGEYDLGLDTNLDGQLTPPNSTGGEVPSEVVTDENGFADFKLEFLKTYAVWVADRIRASTTVSGTESTSYLEFSLPYEKTEGEAHLLGNSPWPCVLEASVAAGGANDPISFAPVISPDYDDYSNINANGEFIIDPALPDPPDPLLDPPPNERWYQYTDATAVVGDTASDEITVSAGGYPTVTFPVRIVFVP